MFEQLSKWLIPNKPYAATDEEWSIWKQDTMKKHPIKYWLSEQVLPTLEDIIMYPLNKLYSVKYYIVNRWIDQSHALVAHPKHVKPGQYMDFSERILYCLFDELVDFVEIEKAHMNFRWNKTEKKKWWQTGKWRTRTYRNIEAGLDYLRWESELTNEDYMKENEQLKLTSQALVAREIVELYHWWTEIYPNRPDPYEKSGWSAFCDEMRSKKMNFNDRDEETKKKSHSLLDELRNIEEQYQEEETKMLERLIRIRNHLWS